MSAEPDWIPLPDAVRMVREADRLTSREGAVMRLCWWLYDEDIHGRARRLKDFHVTDAAPLAGEAAGTALATGALGEALAAWDLPVKADVSNDVEIPAAFWGPPTPNFAGYDLWSTGEARTLPDPNGTRERRVYSGICVHGPELRAMLGSLTAATGSPPTDASRLCRPGGSPPTDDEMSAFILDRYRAKGALGRVDGELTAAVKAHFDYQGATRPVVQTLVNRLRAEGKLPLPKNTSNVRPDVPRT